MLAATGRKVYVWRPTERTDSYGDVVATVYDPATLKSHPIRRASLRFGPSDVTAQGGRVLAADEAELLVLGRVPAIGTADRIALDEATVYRLDGVPVTRPSLASGTLTTVPLKRTKVT
jgi:hypothetical protein